MQELNKKIIEWAKEREIDKKGTVEGQVIKTIEEMSELIKGICKDDIDLIKDSIGDVYVTLVIGNMLSEYKKDLQNIVKLQHKYFETFGSKRSVNKIKEKARILKGLNDCIGYMVNDLCYGICLGGIVAWLIDIASYYNTDLKECVELAYNEISNRKGKIIDGQFVKESDLK